MRTFSAVINDFLNLYQMISPLRRKILRYLQWFSQKYRSVFPSISTMAKAIGCSESSIKRSTSYFNSVGWICKLKRGYQSNIYFMNEEIINLDLDNPNLFLREKRPIFDPTVDPVLDLYPKSKGISTDEKVLVDEPKNKKSKENRSIPNFLCMQGLSKEEQQRLANEFADYELLQAKENAIWYVRQGNNIKSLVRFMWGMAKKIK